MALIYEYQLRCVLKDTVWPAPQVGGKPILIEANTGIVYSVHVMHRQKDLWGPDGKSCYQRSLEVAKPAEPFEATEFDPDRFLDGRLHKYLTANPFIFLPFNGGPRICLGQQVCPTNLCTALSDPV